MSFSPLSSSPSCPLLTYLFFLIIILLYSLPPLSPSWTSSFSSVQIVPAIAPLVKTLKLYQRSPNWILPRDSNSPFSGLTKWVFSNVPFAQKAYRNFLFLSVISSSLPSSSSLSSCYSRFSFPPHLSSSLASFSFFFFLFRFCFSRYCKIVLVSHHTPLSVLTLFFFLSSNQTK
jgi:hypothetical protein